MKYGVCNDYINTKKMLELEGFNVKHLFTDTRDDSGDDGGYLIAISEKNKNLYLQIVSINYNLDVDSHVLDEKTLKETNGVADYIIFDSIDEIKDFLREFVRVMDSLVEAQEQEVEGDEFYGESPEEFEEWLNDKWDVLKFQEQLSGTKEDLIFMLAEFMYKCYFPYSEYSKHDRIGILGMTDKQYIFIDEDQDEEDEY